MSPCCENCPMYVASGQFDTGECRRYPRYEVRKPQDWCGEHPQVLRLSFVIHPDEPVRQRTPPAPIGG